MTPQLTTRGWGIVANGRFLMPRVFGLRVDAISWWVGWKPADKSIYRSAWRFSRKHGTRCVRVTITVEER